MKCCQKNVLPLVYPDTACKRREQFRDRTRTGKFASMFSSLTPNSLLQNIYAELINNGHGNSNFLSLHVKNIKKQVKSNIILMRRVKFDIGFSPTMSIY